MNKRNLGIFYIQSKVIQDNPQLIADMFKALNMIIVRAEMLFQMDSIEYMAICDQFALVTPGCSPPRYEVQLRTRHVKKDIIIPGEDPDATTEVFAAVQFVKEGSNAPIH